MGLVIDANLHIMNSVASGRQRASNEVGALLGGVAGYEAAKRQGRLSAGSGAHIGAVAGATVQDVLRSHNERDSYLAICDVNMASSQAAVGAPGDRPLMAETSSRHERHIAAIQGGRAQQDRWTRPP